MKKNDDEQIYGDFVAREEKRKLELVLSNETSSESSEHDDLPSSSDEEISEQENNQEEENPAGTHFNNAVYTMENIEPNCFVITFVIIMPEKLCC